MTYRTMYIVFFFSLSGDHRDLHVLTHSFPTLLSSDLFLRRGADLGHDVGDAFHAGDDLFHGLAGLLDELGAVADLLDRIADQPLDLLDRKSTRLNSSH